MKALLFFLTAISSRLLAQQPLSFEVASVKVRPAGSLIAMIGESPSGSRLTLEAMSLSDLVCWAYNVKPWQVAGGPSWAGIQKDRTTLDDSTHRFDIDAKAEGAPSWEDFRRMLQSLLASRFHPAIELGQGHSIRHLVLAGRYPRRRSGVGARASGSLDRPIPVGHARFGEEIAKSFPVEILLSEGRDRARVYTFFWEAGEVFGTEPLERQGPGLATLKTGHHAYTSWFQPDRIGCHCPAPSPRRRWPFLARGFSNREFVAAMVAIRCFGFAAVVIGGSAIAARVAAAQHVSNSTVPPTAAISRARKAG